MTRNFRSVAALSRDYLLILAAILIATWSRVWWVTLPCLIWIGLMQFAIGEALLHEASHFNLFRRSRRWNDWCGALCALPFLTTLRDWRAEHLQHHRLFATADDHIVLDYTVHQLKRPSPPVGWVWFGKPLLGLTVLHHLSGLLEINTVRGWLQIAAFWAPIVAICWVTGALFELALYWFVPQLAVFATLLHWSEIADHYRTRSGSRSRIGRFHNWVFHNNGYHAVHHRFPAIPFHGLPAAHGETSLDPADVTRGWWGAWRQISRAPEPVPEQWTEFWPKGEP
ncbi:MAG TPA: fatty acid desaturase [Vicinamibacterales bacterium]|nr:fatty acid desaturase [Vicinamibacterales bacterium]